MTLLVAVADAGRVAGTAVGDGDIVCSLPDSYDLLVPSERDIVDLKYPSVTIPLQHANWENSYRFGYCDDCDGVAVFSDGLDEFLWENGDSLDVEFLNWVFDVVQNAAEGNKAAPELAETLTDESYRNVGDDKTAVVGDLGPEA